MNIKGMIGGAVAAAIGLGGCASAAQEKPAPVELNSYILLDRTGSMSGIWDEALGSVNAYVDSVIEPDEGPQVINDITFAVFDAQEGFQFDILRKNVSGETWMEVTSDEVNPRGMTPLFDAIGRIMSVAEADAPEKAVIVIMTDGKENASQEYTKEQAKAALDRAEKRGWQVVFLGAEFANFADADSVGVSRSKQMAVSKDQLGVTMENLAKKNRGYAQEIAPSVDFDEEDRALAEEEDVKQRKGGN
jgi:hypothetical protein